VQVVVADVVKPVRPAALLDFGRNKSSRWQEVAGMPDWWGHEGSNCGQQCVSKWENGVLTVVPLPCKQWSCELCGYMRYGWFVRNAERAIREHGLCTMWTLTLSTVGRTGDQSFFDVQVAWPKFRARLTRRCGHFEYLKVVETTQAGYAHLHVIVKQRFEWHVVSRLWLECTGDSSVVHFRKLDGVGAARYVAKYIGKEARLRADRRSVLAGQHLFSKSKGIVFDAFMAKGKGWTIVKRSYRDMVERARRNCYVIADVGWPQPRLELEAPNGYESLRSYRPHSPDSPLWRGNGRWG
jgi:hypothetical protein